MPFLPDRLRSKVTLNPTVKCATRAEKLTFLRKDVLLIVFLSASGETADLRAEVIGEYAEEVGVDLLVLYQDKETSKQQAFMREITQSSKRAFVWLEDIVSPVQSDWLLQLVTPLVENEKSAAGLLQLNEVGAVDFKPGLFAAYTEPFIKKDWVGSALTFEAQISERLRDEGIVLRTVESLVVPSEATPLTIQSS
jgi:hypothetical protein